MYHKNKNHNIMTENMAKIQLAIEIGATVQNQKGERIMLPGEGDFNRTTVCVKCYVNTSQYYWASSEKQELIIDGKPFEDWLEAQPLECFDRG